MIGQDPGRCGEYGRAEPVFMWIEAGGARGLSEDGGHTIGLR
ncbi:hypothetical protein [Lentzea sp. NPDC004782]